MISISSLQVHLDFYLLKLLHEDFPSFLFIFIVKLIGGHWRGGGVSKLSRVKRSRAS